MATPPRPWTPASQISPSPPTSHENSFLFLEKENIAPIPLPLPLIESGGNGETHDDVEAEISKDEPRDAHGEVEDVSGSSVPLESLAMSPIPMEGSIVVTPAVRRAPKVSPGGSGGSGFVSRRLFDKRAKRRSTETSSRRLPVIDAKAVKASIEKLSGEVLKNYMSGV